MCIVVIPFPSFFIQLQLCVPFQKHTVIQWLDTKIIFSLIVTNYFVLWPCVNGLVLLFKHHKDGIIEHFWFRNSYLQCVHGLFVVR